MDAYLGLFSDPELFKTTDLRWAEMDATFSSVLLAANNEAAAAAPKRIRLAARKYALGLQAFGSATKMAIAEMRNINDLARQANEIELGAYTLSFNTSRQIAEPIIKKEMKEHTEKVMTSKKRLEDTLMSLHTWSLDIFRAMTELQQANKSVMHLAEHPIADMSDKMKKALTVKK